MFTYTHTLIHAYIHTLFLHLSTMGRVQVIERTFFLMIFDALTLETLPTILTLDAWLYLVCLSYVVC